MWLAGLLADSDGGAEGDWTNDERGAPSDAGLSPAIRSSLPTMEDMLAAWARDSTKFLEIERRVSQYLPAVMEHAKLEEPGEVEMLRGFESLWRNLRSGLGLEAIRGKRA